jgi:hypothetical protein
MRRDLWISIIRLISWWSIGETPPQQYGIRLPPNTLDRRLKQGQRGWRRSRLRWWCGQAGAFSFLVLPCTVEQLLIGCQGEQETRFVETFDDAGVRDACIVNRLDFGQ